MPLEQIIPIIIAVLAAIFVWGIIGKVFKLMFYAGIIIFLLLAANTYFIYQDFKDLKENFGPSKKEVLLVEDNEVLTGMVLQGNDFEAISSNQLNEISSELKNGNYENILGDNYKLMIFDINIVGDLDDEINFFGETMSQEEIKETLKSANNQEKSALFAVLLSNEILANKNPLFFFSHFKKGNIMIYPETALFKTVKIIPIGVFKDVAKSLFAKTKEKAKTFIVEETEQ